MSSSLGGNSLLAPIRIWNNIPVPPLDTNTPTLRPLPIDRKQTALDVIKHNSSWKYAVEILVSTNLKTLCIPAEVTITIYKSVKLSCLCFLEQMYY